MNKYNHKPFYLDSYTDLVLLEQKKAGSKDQDQTSLKPEQVAIDRITEQSLKVAQPHDQQHQQDRYDQALDQSNIASQQPHNRHKQQQQQQQVQQYNQDQSIIVPQPPSIRRTHQGRRQAAAGQFRPPPPLLPTKSRFQERLYWSLNPNATQRGV